MYWDEIGELLDRTAVACKSRAKLVGYRVGRRPWSPDERAFIEQNCIELTAQQIADQLGRTLTSVRGRIHNWGLGTQVLDHKALKLFARPLHADGWCDTEIVAAWNDEYPDQHCNREWLGDLRQRWGWPNNALSEHRRRQVAEKTREQLAAAGLPSLAAVRAQAFADFGVRNGWPGVNRPRMVQILNLLYEHGPHTRLQICQAIDLRTTTNGKNPVSRKWCSGNGPGGTYTATLMRMGLVVKLPGRPVRGKGQGRSFCMYAISPNVQRSPINVKPKHNEPAGDRGEAAA